MCWSGPLLRIFWSAVVPAATRPLSGTWQGEGLRFDSVIGLQAKGPLSLREEGLTHPDRHLEVQCSLPPNRLLRFEPWTCRQSQNSFSPAETRWGCCIPVRLEPTVSGLSWRIRGKVSQALLAAVALETCASDRYSGENSMG